MRLGQNQRLLVFFLGEQMIEALLIFIWYSIGLFGAAYYLVWDMRNAGFIALFVSLGPVSLILAFASSKGII